MANRHNHYEAAFEAFLRDRRVAYVAVNEQRRSRIPAGTLKSVDFLISPADGATLLVDVKGRRFPSGLRSKQYWKNWSTWDDLRSLARWQDQLGSQSLSLLVFVYDVVGERSPLPSDLLFPFRDRLYAMLAVRAADYIRFYRPLSPKWHTVTMPTGKFREAAVPLDELLGARSTGAASSTISSTIESPIHAAAEVGTTRSSD
jgi:hypothetical protein